MYKYKSETWEISRIENNVIYYKSLNPLNSKERQIKISENFFNKKIPLKFYWPWQKNKRHFLTLEKCDDEIIGVLVDSKPLYHLQPEDYPEDMKKRIEENRQRETRFAKEAPEKMGVLRQEYVSLPIFIRARLDYFADTMNLSYKSYVRLQNEVKFCREIVKISTLPGVQLLPEIRNWLIENDFCSSKEKLPEEYLDFLKNGNNMLFFDMAIANDDINEDNFSDYIEKFKFYTLYSPWFEFKITPFMMEEYWSLRKNNYV